MSALATTVKVLVVSTVKLVDTIKHVLRGVAVDYVEQHGDTKAVSGINELLEVFRSSISTASCKEVVDLVSKTGIERCGGIGRPLAVHNVVVRIDIEAELLSTLLHRSTTFGIVNGLDPILGLGIASF
ncbi:hypothetical protein HG530_000911 [Fusarium avenaceum]|nr:hypothetical protein HG530_000911 [Fusarium avenaceum]